MDIKVIILEDEFAIAGDFAAILADAGYEVIGRFETHGGIRIALISRQFLKLFNSW